MATSYDRSYCTHLWMHSLTVLLRFVMVAPILGFQGSARSHHKLVSHNVLLHNGTYNPAIATGERFADQWGGFVMIWNFCIWVASLILLPPLQLPIALGDTFFTVYLSRATAYQSGYAPKDFKACRDMSSFHDQRPLGTNESFFAAAARLNETVTTPTKMCQSFVRGWQYGVSVSFFYALISLLGIASSIGCRHMARQQARQQTLRLYGKAKLYFLNFWSVTLYSIFFIRSIPAYIFRVCLPTKAKAPVRTARRYAVKAVLGVEQKTEFALKELKTELYNKDAVGRYKGVQGESTPLSQFLGVYDMLMMVIPYLHYVDAVNLASVSKSVRDSVLPQDDVYRRIALFKTLTCSDAYRAPCWVCSSQTCADCYKLASVTLTIAIHHLENCEPYCKACYYQHVALKPPPSKARLENVACQCAPILTPSSRLYKRYLQARYPRRMNRVLPTGKRPICRACSILTSEQMTLRKNESGKIMLKKGRKSDGQKWDTCAKEGCGKRLDAGPRFWVCTYALCRRECTSNLHQAWGADSKGAEEAV